MRVRLHEITRIQIGFLPRSAPAIISSQNQMYRLIQMRDMKDQAQLDVSGALRLALPDADDRYRLKAGDVLFQARGNRHPATIIRDVSPQTLASNHFYIVRVHNANVLPEYVAWYLNEPPAQSVFSTLAQKTTMTLIPREALESLEIDVPALAVQRKIVELADLARFERQLVEKLQCKRDALIRAVSLGVVRAENHIE